MPKEAEITAAMKSELAMPDGGSCNRTWRTEYPSDRRSNYHGSGKIGIFVMLMNQGFDVKEVLDNEIPEEINILLLAEMRSPFTPEQRVNWEKYVAREGI